MPNQSDRCIAHNVLACFTCECARANDDRDEGGYLQFEERHETYHDLHTVWGGIFSPLCNVGSEESF